MSLLASSLTDPALPAVALFAEVELLSDPEVNVVPAVRLIAPPLPLLELLAYVCVEMAWLVKASPAAIVTLPPLPLGPLLPAWDDASMPPVIEMSAPPAINTVPPLPLPKVPDELLVTFPRLTLSLALIETLPALPAVPLVDIEYVPKTVPLLV
jgi:hypothetical protein